MRPGSLHRVNWPTDVNAPVVIEILKGRVLERLAPADTSVGHQEVDSPEMRDGRRDQVTATFRGGDIAVIGDRLASTGPNEVGHLFRNRGVPPEPRYVGPQVIHHHPGTTFGEKFNVGPPQPAACPRHNRDPPLQRDSFSHLAILFQLLWEPPAAIAVAAGALLRVIGRSILLVARSSRSSLLVEPSRTCPTLTAGRPPGVSRSRWRHA